MEIGRRVLDPTQREGLDRPVGARHCAVDQYRLVEALGVQIVHQVVGVVGRRVAGAALPLAEKDGLAAQFRLARFARVEAAEQIELRGRREIQQLLNLGHVVHLTAAFERVHPLFRGDYRVPVKIGGALLELREILDRFQRALRAEQALDVDAAQ